METTRDFRITRFIYVTWIAVSVLKEHCQLVLAVGRTQMRRAKACLCYGLICTLFALFVSQSPARADIITEWNQTALTTLLRAQLPTGAPTRAMAMLHAAMFEAVNSIDPQF